MRKRLRGELLLSDLPKQRKEIITIIVMREHLNRENESYFKLINGKPQFFKSRW